MSENKTNTIRTRIFDHDELKIREIVYCGELAIVVAPTMGAMPSVFKALLGIGDKTAEEINADIASLSKTDLVEMINELSIYSLRQPENKLPFFTDTPEARELLKYVPFDEGMKVFEASVELLDAKLFKN